MVKPVVSRDIIKKRQKAFIRHKADRFKRMGQKWRKPRGEDSPVRRRFKGEKAMPNKGYGSCRATKFIHPDGFKHFMIYNVQDLYMLIMQNRKYAAVIAHTVGARTRKAILRKATELDVRVVNGIAKLRKLEHE